MADWQEAVQASVMALIFALMVAKLVSVVISFRVDNLRVERATPETEELLPEGFDGTTGENSEVDSSSDGENSEEELEIEGDVNLDEAENLIAAQEVQRVIEPERDESNREGDADVGLHPLAEERAATIPKLEVVEGGRDVKLNAVEEQKDDTNLESVDRKTSPPVEALGELSDSDEWEGVESTELEESFSAAATFVSMLAASPGLKVSNETQLLLYGLYKLATEGPCSTAQPSAYKMSARAKWNAWQKLGNIGQEEAMQRYIAVVHEMSPSFAKGTQNTEKLAGDRAVEEGSQRGGIGPVFSLLAINEEGGEAEGNVEAIHMFARDGDQAGLQRQVESGTPVDLKDSDGRTALHWAADGGHLQAVMLLLARGAEIQTKDMEGQTALHYATTCEQEEVAKYLLQKGADATTKDNDGISPLSSCPANWVWMAAKT